jgi:hypothetical protein
MTLRTVPSDRDVRTRSTGFRVDLGTRYVTRRMERGLWAGGVGNVRTRSTGFRVDLGTRYVTACVLQEGVGGSFQQYVYNRYNILHTCQNLLDWFSR